MKVFNFQSSLERVKKAIGELSWREKVLVFLILLVGLLFLIKVLFLPSQRGETLPEGTPPSPTPEGPGGPSLP